MKTPKEFIILFLALVFIVAACEKNNDSPTSSSIAKSTTIHYSAIGNASVNFNNGEISVNNLGTNGNDGLSIDLLDYCSGDFVIDTIGFVNDSDYVCLKAIDTQGNAVSSFYAFKIGSYYELGYELEKTVIQYADFELLNGSSLEYTSNLYKKHPYIVWGLLQSEILDFHVDVVCNQETSLEEVETDWTFFGSGQSGNGSTMQAPDGTTIRCDRARLSSGGLKYPVSHFELTTKGIGTITISQDDFGRRGDCCNN
jgi:hypothetical protein